MVPVRYYLDTQPTPPLLLRRTGEVGVSEVDESFLDNQWRSTILIGLYMVGRNDWVEDITEVEARRIVPAAFKTSG